jgi:hypothetical protein
MSPYEALSDHLLALRALLEPEGPASARLAGRLAVLCATPERRGELAERVLAAIELERGVVAGSAVEHAGAEALAAETADHLRALLRDVICGHLDPDLTNLADELLLEELEAAKAAEAAEGAAAAAAAEQPPAQPEYFEQPSTLEPFAAQRSGKEIFGDPGEAQEILDIFI